MRCRYRPAQTSQAPIEIKADQLDLNQHPGTAVYSGDVDVRQGGHASVVIALKLSVTTRVSFLALLPPESAPIYAINSMIRTRPNGRMGTPRGLSRSRAGRIELIDQAELTQAGDQFTGGRLEYFIDREVVQARSDVNGSEPQRIRMTLQPAQSGSTMSIAEAPPIKTLYANHLAKSYKRRRVVKDISLEIAQGSVVGLLGPNGAGKTTSFYMIVGLVKSDAGTVRIDEQDLTRVPMHERAMAGIGYLPQEASIFRKLSVADNIMAILETRKDLDRAGREQRLEALLDDFHITHIRDNLGMSLSGGERRRVEIARFLGHRARVYLAGRAICRCRSHLGW